MAVVEKMPLRGDGPFQRRPSELTCDNLDFYGVICLL